MKKNSRITFASPINYIGTRYFFGFENKNYEGFILPIATPEKAIIDSIGIIPFSIFKEAVEKANQERMIKYLKEIKKSSIIKRIGYMLEKNGHNVYNELKNKINNRYILLDPLARKSGIKNKKWKIIINIKW